MALRPCCRIHIDYAGPYLGHRYLVVIDAHSKWIEVIPMNSTTITATVEKLRILFAQFGIPEVVVSNNGTNFVSKELILKSSCSKMISNMLPLLQLILHPTG